MPYKNIFCFCGLALNLFSVIHSDMLLKGHMSRQQLVSTTKNFGVEFHCFVTFYFCFMNSYCRKNSASIPCFVLNKRHDCIALANQVHDTCPLNSSWTLQTNSSTLKDANDTWVSSAYMPALDAFKHKVI